MKEYDVKYQPYAKLAESIKCKGDLLVTYEFISCKIVPRGTLK